MSMAEPKAIGTVVVAALDGVADSRTEWVLAPFGEWVGRHKTVTYTYWENLVEPVVVHEGYDPPPPEPTGVLAVIRDGEGLLRFRRENRRGYFLWERADGYGALLWELMPQPVEVLFEGVTE